MMISHPVDYQLLEEPIIPDHVFHEYRRLSRPTYLAGIRSAYPNSDQEYMSVSFVLDTSAPKVHLYAYLINIVIERAIVVPIS
jgi:hypothetical protein